MNGEEAACEVKALLLCFSLPEGKVSEGLAVRIIKRLNKKSECAIM